MPKPICFIKMDFQEIERGSGKIIDIPGIQSGIEKQFNNEYYVLVAPKFNADDPISLEVFYEKDFTDIKYEELKAFIIESISKTYKE